MASEHDGIEKTTVNHVEDVGVTKEAKIASDTEHQTTLWQALKSNKKAAVWSAIISLTIIMEGYDVGMLIGGLARCLEVICLLAAPRLDLSILRVSFICKTIRQLGRINSVVSSLWAMAGRPK